MHVPWARDLARQLLSAPLPRRWAHTQGVGRRAESVAHIVGADADLLICTAWLHDVGYTPALATTGFHPLDGARYLRDMTDASTDLCRLVAHHSCATIEARRRGLDGDLLDEFPQITGGTADALTFCDMTTSPDGQLVDVETRLGEIASRYGARDIVAESMREARPYIEQTVKRVQDRIAS